ncbi:hypothetical protein Ancab_029483 [Ancistrocladus abbreviatus]
MSLTSKLLEAFGRNNFHKKCKSALRLTKERVEMIKKKRNAMQKYLKNDIAELLKNGLDTIAYGRAEGLCVELNLSSCYDYVDECCSCILENLNLMQKQSECPEECKVAAASLIHAAARFADLPELRDIRQLFTEKYGNVFEHSVNKEFAAKLKSSPPTEMKLQLMQGIAQEFSITWDSTSLKQKLWTPPVTEEDQPSNFGPSNVTSDAYRLRRSEVEEEEKQDLEDKQDDVEDCSPSTKDRSRRESKCSNPLRSSLQEEVNYRNPFTNRVVPAPYVKPKVDRSSISVRGQTSHTVPLKQREDFQSGKTGNKDVENHTSASIQMGINPTKNSPGKNQKDTVDEHKPSPRSVRSRFLRKSSGLADASSSQINQNAEELPSGVRQHDAGQQQRIVEEDPGDQKDKEGKLMDDLLIQKGSIHLRRNSTELPNSRLSKSQEEDKAEPKYELPAPPGRRSLSHEPESMSSHESRPGHARAASFQSDGALRRMYPQLPDFDELAGRIEALSKLKM